MPNSAMLRTSCLFVVVKHTRCLGASEDLVVAAAERMLGAGRSVAFWFNFRPLESEGWIQRLRIAGCRIHFHDQAGFAFRVRRRLGRANESASIIKSLRQALTDEKPEMVLLNQGGNSDAACEAAVLQEERIDYTVLNHAATEWSWPEPDFLPFLRAIFTGARRCLFVSNANRQLTEAQLGMVLPNAAVVYNPCKFTRAEEIPWPACDDAWSLAVVSRIENKQKGHDLIIQALARPEWRRRPLSVTFYGDGPHRESLAGYAENLGLESVSFPGHCKDIRALWSQHHGFIQASRSEGYGLSLLEAMFCGRLAIATPFPAAVEFIREGETGFLARGATVAEVADVLERAWSQRHRWQEIGAKAAGLVDAVYPKDPVGDFLKILQEDG